MRRTALLAAAACVIAWLFGPAAADPPKLKVTINGRQKTLVGVEGLRYCVKRRRHAMGEKIGKFILWDHIEEPESLYLLALCLQAQGKKEDAAVYFTLLGRVLEGRNADPADVRKYKAKAEARLKRLNREHERQKAAFLRAAPGKKFDAAAKVDDGWMLVTRADLFRLWDLNAWKIIGGKKHVEPPEWIHHRQGRMHRCGVKYCDLVDGRKGVLFTIAFKAKPAEKNKWAHAHLKRLGHPNQLALVNHGDCKYLRMGLKAAGSTFAYKVYVDGTEIHTGRVTKAAWADVKIELPPRTAAAETRPAAGEQPKHQQVLVEIYSPQDERYGGGVWIDYVDFFDD